MVSPHLRPSGIAPPTSEALLAQQLTAFRAALQAEDAAPALDQSPDGDQSSAEATASATAAAAAAAATAAAATASREFEGLYASRHGISCTSYVQVISEKKL